MFKTSEPAPPVLRVDGREVPVTVRRSALAERMSLRLSPAGRGLVLVLPAGVGLGEGLRFAAAQADWVRSRLAAQPERIPFADGAPLPLLGVEHRVRHRPEARRGVWTEDGTINVSGRPEHLERRLRDWLGETARRELSGRAHAMAAAIGRKVRRISVRDPGSRWGSCSAGGNLAFSWRLVLAPEPVLAYVVAHEVAHLVEMNHGVAFWQVVESLMPEMRAARHWLKRHGAALHRYG